MYGGLGWKGYVLSLESGAWKPQVSSRPVWQHWLTVCIPDHVNQSIAAMYMDGPGNSDKPDTTLNAPVYILCQNNPGVTVYLQQVPNEDISFPDHPGGLGEDDLIAYTWRKFLNGSATDPTWLLRLPMTRAGVNAMTAVQDYLLKNHPNVPPITGFLVAGASKRGWTTWTVTATDARVVAAVPIVMPIPDVVPNIAAEWKAYGNWSFALQPYINFDIPKYLFSTPVGIQAIADVVGPLPYMYRFTMPVWNIMACGDEFTLPDSPRFWWNKLPGEKYLRIIPNAEHSMACCILDVTSDILAFLHLITHNIPRPVMNFSMVYQQTPDAPASIQVSTSVKPATVKMWWANTIAGNGRRDFREIICGELKPACLQPVLWFPRDLQPQSDGTYLAVQEAPAAGWTGFLVQCDFEISIGGNRTVWFRISSEVNVVPDTFPFPTCPNSQCNNPPL
jgi:PhoPQ-activated pathogenicity-related protein